MQVKKKLEEMGDHIIAPSFFMWIPLVVPPKRMGDLKQDMEVISEARDAAIKLGKGTTDIPNCIGDIVIGSQNVKNVQLDQKKKKIRASELAKGRCCF